jgi:hypothetical protein
LRALHLELFTVPSVSGTFYQTINLDGFVKRHRRDGKLAIHAQSAWFLTAE